MAPVRARRYGGLAAEQEGPIQVTGRVRALADHIDDPRAAVIDRVTAFRDYMIDTMACGVIHAECFSGRGGHGLGSRQSLVRLRIGSALLAALCRASGIPARLVGGYLLWEAPTEHYWIEAWAPDRGWMPFDLLAWDLSAGGEDMAWRVSTPGRSTIA